jgi:hypothetical protein
MASDGGPLDPFGTQLGGLELNVLVAGLEASVGIWLVMRLPAGLSLLPRFPEEWQWSYGVIALVALIGVFLLGLIVEGLAGLLELGVTRSDGVLRPWYAKRVNLPSDWGPGQRWMWQSPQAAAEFGRRRTRLLVSRNTAFCVLIFSLILAIALPIGRGLAAWPLTLLCLLVAFLGTWLFGWLWVDAHAAWNKAVQDAGDIGPPH